MTKSQKDAIKFLANVMKQRADERMANVRALRRSSFADPRLAADRAEFAKEIRQYAKMVAKLARVK